MGGTLSHFFLHVGLKYSFHIYKTRPCFGQRLSESEITSLPSPLAEHHLWNEFFWFYFADVEEEVNRFGRVLQSREFSLKKGDGVAMLGQITKEYMIGLFTTNLVFFFLCTHSQCF